MSRKSTSSKNHNPLRHFWRKSRSWILPLVGFGGAGVLMVGIYTIARGGDEENPAVVDRNIPQSSTASALSRLADGTIVETGALSLETIVDEVLRAYGAKEQEQALTSLQRISKFWPTDAEVPFDLIAFWKAPDSYYYLLSQNHFSLRHSYNGETVASANVRNGKVVSANLMTGDERERFIRNSLIAEPVVFALQQLERLRYIGPGAVNGRPCHVIELRRRRYNEKLYFDQASFLCLQREREDSDLDVHPKQILIQYDGFREFGGLIFHTEQVLYGDGKPLNRIQTEEIRINPGILSSAFDPPSEVNGT